jgi:phosphate starvation-inducible protein PhoH
MAKLNKAFVQEKEFEEIIETNNEENIIKFKQEIAKIILRDIKLKAKNDSQRDLIHSIKNNEITICSGMAGTGKAQPLDSLVLAEDGYKNMGDIKINDKIFTKSGNITNVIGIFPQGEKDIYKIIFSDDSFTECCEEHLWLTKSTSDRSRNKDFKIRNLGELKNNFILKRDGRKNYSIPITEPINFSSKKTKINPYLMGILIGDGCFVSPNIRLTTIDDKIINSVNKLLEDKYILSQVSSDLISYNIIFKNKNDVHNRFNENVIPFTRLISDYDLLGLKSDEKFIPNDFKFNSIENRILLLQGLMDSDGTIEKKSRSLTFSTSSKKLIEDFRFLVESLGGVVNKLRIKKSGYKNNENYIECKDSYTYSFRIPNNINPFKLERKLKLFKKKSKYFPIRYIKNIEYVGKKQAQCIMVEDESHTYLTNNFIVTHNTYVALAYALSLLRKQNNRYKNIYLVKSVTTLKGEELGFLKGDLKDKIEPFMWSFYINMEKIIMETTMKTLIEKNIVRPFPLAYMRGASLDDCIIIADEMQNVSVENSQTLLTRIGSNSKLILLGDINQIDMKNKEETSLNPLLKMFKETENIGTILMDDKNDNVRNPLISVIEEKFKEFYKNKKENDNRSYSNPRLKQIS